MCWPCFSNNIVVLVLNNTHERVTQLKNWLSIVNIYICIIYSCSLLNTKLCCFQQFQPDFLSLQTWLGLAHLISYLYNSKLFKNFEGIWILIEPLYMIWSRSSIIHICDDLCYYTCLLLAQTSGLLPIRQILCKISNIWDDLDLAIMPGSLIRISDLACRWSTA